MAANTFQLMIVVADMSQVTVRITVGIAVPLAFW